MPLAGDNRRPRTGTGVVSNPTQERRHPPGADIRGDDDDIPGTAGWGTPYEERRPRAGWPRARTIRRRGPERRRLASVDRHPGLGRARRHAGGGTHSSWIAPAPAARGDGVAGDGGNEHVVTSAAAR